MILIALLDRCLTGWRQMGRTVFVLCINQLIARALLLDRCLTGGTARVDYLLRGVRPYVPDAWIDSETLDEQDGGIGKVGYEINFNRVFFGYQPPRPLAEIDAELAEVEKRIMDLLREVTE
ncbi:hypothetical protein [Acidithiobacillus albertensis]|uniref:hypothetical protein n=1 Tax=Acidithiobacillus albertensis TaxID=119978 RepID=UPI00094ACB51|nr:hypothetical protein [Acidithiobacillus albertensis]